MRYVDLHCDTLMNCYLGGEKLRENKAHIDLVRLKAAGALAQCFAIFIPTNGVAEKTGVNLSPQEYFDACLEVYKREIAENEDIISPALRAGDIAKNAAAGKMSAILTIEDGVVVNGEQETLDELFNLGVRLITLTWNYENCFGYPQNADPDAMKLALKPFGIEALRRMNELGIIADVSHLSEGGFYDVAEYSRKPFTASHSCSRALCGASRNLDDRQLKTLGEKGGVCGVNFVPAFLENDSVYGSIEMIVRHARHIADMAGVGAVAFGSDFDGFSDEIEFKDCSGMPLVIDALAGAFHESEIDKICCENALRLFRENMQEG